MNSQWPWASSNLQNESNFASKIWFNLQAGSPATKKLGHPLVPQYTFVSADNPCRAGNSQWPWVTSNLQNQHNFHLEIGFNLRAGSPAIANWDICCIQNAGSPVIRQLGHLLPPKCTIMFADHPYRAKNLQQPGAKSNLQNQHNFGSEFLVGFMGRFTSHWEIGTSITPKMHLHVR
ncbi:hypothetical protein B0H19DRAFT_1084284 [Mycena capillaripes]|nr:hypothetical protein B0H19DRAFT_1084284 [Mycena capillaripes]